MRNINIFSNNFIFVIETFIKLVIPYIFVIEMGCRKSLYCSASTESKGDLDRMHSLNYNKKKQENYDLNTLLLLELGFFSDLKNKKMRFNPRPFSHPVPIKPKKLDAKPEENIGLNLEITKKIDELLQSREKKSQNAQPLTHSSINPELLNHIEVRQQIIRQPQMSMIKTELQPQSAFGEMNTQSDFIEIESSTEAPVAVSQEKEMHSWMKDDQVKGTQKTLWGFAKINAKTKQKAPTKTHLKSTKTKVNNEVMKTKLELEKTKKEIEERQKALLLAKELEKQKEQELKAKEIESKKKEKLREIERKKRLKLQKIKERELKKVERQRQKELLKQEKIQKALEKNALAEKMKKQKQKELELKAKEEEKRKQEKLRELELKKKEHEKQKEIALRAKEEEKRKQEKIKVIESKNKQKEKVKHRKLKTEKPKNKLTFGLFKKDTKKKEQKEKTTQEDLIPKIDKGAIPKEEHIPWDEDVEKLIPIIDNLLENLPEEVIEDFANSDDFGLYEKVVSKYKK